MLIKKKIKFRSRRNSTEAAELGSTSQVSHNSKPNTAAGMSRQRKKDLDRKSSMTGSKVGEIKTNHFDLND